MGRYAMDATVRDVIYIFTMLLSSQWSSSQKQDKQGVRRCLVEQRISLSHPPNQLSGCGCHCHGYLILSVNYCHRPPHNSGHAAHMGDGSGQSCELRLACA